MATGEKVRERLAKREKNSKKRKSLVQKQMRHLAKRYGFFFAEEVDCDLVALAEAGVAVEVGQVCPVVVALGRDTPIHAQPLAIGTIRQMAWPPDVVEPGVVVRIV